MKINLGVSVLIFLLLLGSCIPKSKTIDPITKDEYSKIKKTAVYFKVNQNIRVMAESRNNIISDYSFDPNSSLSLGLGGFIFLELIPVLLIAVTDYYLDSRSDKKDKEIIQSKLEGIDIKDLIIYNINEGLEFTNTKFDIEGVESNSRIKLKAKGFDSILEINLNEWNIEPCHIQKQFVHPEAEKLIKEWNEYIKNAKAKDKARQRASGNLIGEYKYTEQDYKKKSSMFNQINNYYKGGMIQSQFKAYSILIDLVDNSIIWERQEIYKENKCVWLSEIRSNPEILFNTLLDAVHILTRNTVNEIY